MPIKNFSSSRIWFEFCPARGARLGKHKFLLFVLLFFCPNSLLINYIKE